jgi:hypothetical protein
MGQQGSFITQTQYYSPAFNAAIFDGPIRIYFAQDQESLAMKVYFSVQAKIQSLPEAEREAFRLVDSNIFVMLYPSNESFQISFGHRAEDIVNETLLEDFVFGTRGPVMEDGCELLTNKIKDIAVQLIENATVMTKTGEFLPEASI